MSPRRRHHFEEECAACFGCGHVCTRCDDPINACECDLDTEEMEDCEDCNATGRIPPDPPLKQKGMPYARA